MAGACRNFVTTLVLVLWVNTVTFLVNAASTRPCYECEDLSGNEDGSCYNLVQGDKDMKNVTCPDVCFTKTKKYGDALREVTRGCRTTTDMTEGCEKSGVFYDICVELCDTTLCNAEPDVELLQCYSCSWEKDDEDTSCLDGDMTSITCARDDTTCSIVEKHFGGTLTKLTRSCSRDDPQDEKCSFEVSPSCEEICEGKLCNGRENTRQHATTTISPSIVTSNTTTTVKATTTKASKCYSCSWQKVVPGDTCKDESSLTNLMSVFCLSGVCLTKESYTKVAGVEDLTSLVRSCSTLGTEKDSCTTIALGTTECNTVCTTDLCNTSPGRATVPPGPRSTLFPEVTLNPGSLFTTTRSAAPRLKADLICLLVKITLWFFT